MRTEKSGLVPVESEKEVESRLAREKAEHEHGVEACARWILDTLQKRETYGEKIPLKRDLTFDVPGNVTELPLDVAELVRAAKQMEHSQKGLYDLAKEISQKYPELRFSFNIDPQGEWVQYIVKKQNLNVGDEVIWERHGLPQWQEPKKIISIYEDPKSKRKHALVKGVAFGMPLDELALIEGD